MIDETPNVTDELKSVKRLNNRPLIILGIVGILFVLIIAYGFSQLEKGKAAKPEEETALSEPAPLPQSIQETAVDGVIPADRPVPPPAAAATTADVPVVIPDASGNVGQGQLLAGPSESEAKQNEEHQAALRQITMDNELERKRYFLSRQIDAIKRADTTNRIAAESDMEITLGVNQLDNRFRTAEANGAPQSFGQSGGSVFPANAALSPAALSANGQTGVSSIDAQAELLKALGSQSQTGPDSDINGQSNKRAFLSEQQGEEDYLNRFKKQPVSPYEIKQGTIIPGVMITGINSDLPGRLVGQVLSLIHI